MPKISATSNVASKSVGASVQTKTSDSFTIDSGKITHSSPNVVAKNVNAAIDEIATQVAVNTSEPSSPSEGDLWYDSDDNLFYVRVDSAWKNIVVADLLDQDNFSSNSATAVATQQSIKAYVDTQITGGDLDLQGDSGGALSVDLDSETLTLAGGTGIDTVGSSETVTFNLDLNELGTETSIASGDFISMVDIDDNGSGKITLANFQGYLTGTGALNSGSITSGFGNIDTGSSTITTTGLISGGSLDIDNVLINGTTIGHTDDTDLITVADGLVTVAGEISVTTLDIGGTNVASTAAELNLLDGSAKSTSSITIADADAFIVIDGTTTKQIPASDLETYMESSLDTLSNVTTVGTLNSGAISSGFGVIDIGSSGLTAGATQVSSLSILDGNITNAGDINCDSISIDDAAVGLNIDFGGNTTLNKITLTDNLADALNITESSNSYLKFVTSNSGEKITLGKKLEAGSVEIEGSAFDIDGGTIDGTDVTVGSGKTLDVSGGTLTLANDQISGDKVSGGTIGTTTITALAGALSLGDNNITNVSDIALDSISADGTDINVAVSDDSATAFTIKQGVNAYLVIDTANSSESVAIGTGISGTGITIGHSTSETTVADNLTVTGNLKVNGDTVTQNVSTMTVNDPIISLQTADDGANLGSDTNKDVGLAMFYHTGSAAKTAFLGWDDSAGKLTFVPDASISSEVVSGSVGTIVADLEGDVTGNVSGTAATVTGAAQSNITSLGTLTTLTVDNVIINATTIGHTSDTDLMTLADGVLTVAGEVDATSLDVSGNADIDGTLEADAITVDGTALATYIRDTVGTNMVSSNTETGITVTYDTSNDNLDFAIDAAQTVITSLLATDIKIGEDDQTKIDFETADEIHFYANNTEQVYLADNIFGPQSDSDVDLGTTGVRWKDAFVDSITVTGEIDGASLDIEGDADINGTLEADVITVNGTALDTHIAGVTVTNSTNSTNATNSSHVLVTDNENTDEDNLITFVEGATSSTGNVGLEMDGHLTYNPSTGRLTATQLAGTLQTASQTNITSVGTIGTGTWQGTTVAVGYGGTGATSLTANGVLIGNGTSAVTAVDLTAKGKILIGDGSGNPQALAVGTNNYVLTADSSEATGMKWASLASAAIDGTANGADNRIATYSSSSALNGEANLTFDGSALTVAGTVTVGSDGSGQDVTFYSGTSGDHFVWDASEEKLTITGTNGQTALDVADGNLVVADNIDLEGDIDVNGTANLDVVDIDGAVNMASTLTIGGACDFNGDLDVDGTTNLDAVDIDGAVQVGENDAGQDVTFFGDTAGAKMVWDASDDSLNLTASTDNRPLYLSAADGNLHVRMTAADDHSNSMEFINASNNAVYCGMFGDQTNGAGNFGIYNGGFHCYIDSGGTFHLPTANVYIANSPSGHTLIGSDANNQNIKIGVGGSGNIQLAAVNTGYAVSVHNDANSDGGKGIQCMAGVDSGGDGGVNFQVATGNGTQVGLISWSNTTTTYATSSDYRLKENVVPLANALTRIDQFKPYNFNFKDNPDLLMDGFLAHEVDEILPYAVVGDKDAVNEDGTIDPQSMDSSHLIPLLVKAVQELSAKVTALENA